MKVLTFMVNKKKYGLSIQNIVTIEKNNRSLTKLPQSNELMIGVVNIRGNVCPVVDLKKHYDDVYTELTEDKKIILVEFEGSVGALLVDDTDNIMDVDPSWIEDFTLDEEEEKSKLVNRDGDIFLLLELENIEELFGI